jgi:hypothetical protein
MFLEICRVPPVSLLSRPAMATSDSRIARHALASGVLGLRGRLEDCVQKPSWAHASLCVRVVHL